MPAGHDAAETVKQIEAAGLIAVIRTDSADAAVAVSRALIAGGVGVLEIALTTPGGVEAIRTVAAELGDRCVVGAGTVLDVRAAGAVIDAGARFVFAPNVNVAVIEAVRSRGRVVVPGALTPTEVWTAWSAGAHMVKLFPANVFGPGYIKDLRGPFPQLKVTPTGGVTLQNVGEWFAAGASAVGVGSNLVRKDWIKAGAWDDIAALARQYVEAVNAARR